MKNYLQLGGVVILFGCVLLLSSCEDDDYPQPVKPRLEIGIGEDITSIVQYFSDLKWIADQAEREDMSAYKNGAPPKFDCATVTRDTLTNKFVIDFGKTNCQCKDKRNRRGKIEVSVIDKYWSPNSVVTIRPQGYFVDGHEIKGIFILSANGLDPRGAQVWRFNTEGSIVTPNSKDSITWDGDFEFHWIQGDNTANEWTDDEWDITGHGFLSSKDGHGWNVHIEKPIHRAMDCRFMDKGAIEIIRPGLAPHLVTYGLNGCDDDANTRIKDEVVFFKLR